MLKVALVIIYNHPYTENIEILENIYGKQFSNIYHLVPFYNGEKSNVIPVYESSYYFHGYIAQGFKFFFKDDFDHYFFIADDLLLNPVINENNYAEHLKLKKNTCFLPGFITLHDRVRFWYRVNDAFSYRINLPGVEASSQLPDYDVALKIFKNFGLEIKPLKFNQIWETPTSMNALCLKIIQDRLYIIRYMVSKFFKRQYHLPYPLVGGYSDIFVVSSDALKQFCHYCGIFAVTKLFVEVALPTSLVLSAKEIVTEKDLNLQGKALWPDGWGRLNGDDVPAKGDYKELGKYNFQLRSLLKDFPAHYLYLHPVKLSTWDTKL
jgi:hypothetical protein